MQRFVTDALVGKYIRKVRKAQKLTQDQIAARLQVRGCDIARGTYAKMEAGIRRITLDELKAIKDALKISTYDEMFREG